MADVATPPSASGPEVALDADGLDRGVGFLGLLWSSEGSIIGSGWPAFLHDLREVLPVDIFRREPMIGGGLAGAVEPDQMNVVQDQHVFDTLDKALSLGVVFWEFCRQHAESNCPQRFHVASAKDGAGVSLAQYGAELKMPQGGAGQRGRESKEGLRNL